jgi:hypothetical protein
MKVLFLISVILLLGLGYSQYTDLPFFFNADCSTDTCLSSNFVLHLIQPYAKGTSTPVCQYICNPCDDTQCAYQKFDRVNTTTISQKFYGGDNTCSSLNFEDFFTCGECRNLSSTQSIQFICEPPTLPPPATVDIGYSCGSANTCDQTLTGNFSCSYQCNPCDSTFTQCANQQWVYNGGDNTVYLAQYNDSSCMFPTSASAYTCNNCVPLMGANISLSPVCTSFTSSPTPTTTGSPTPTTTGSPIPTGSPTPTTAAPTPTTAAPTPTTAAPTPTTAAPTPTTPVDGGFVIIIASIVMIIATLVI